MMGSQIVLDGAEQSRPVEVGISPDHFLTPEWYERDLEAVFRPRWLYAGHVSEIAEPRSYITFQLGTDEVVIMRSITGDVVAYYNFCRHRGHRLVTEKKGVLKQRNLVCSYHGWAFSAEDGSCIFATRMNEGFDKSPWGLHKVWVEDFHGLIFVSFGNEKPVSVAQENQARANLETGFAGYDLRQTKVAASTQIEVAANWKLVLENDNECYHCVLNHPELAQSLDPWTTFTVVQDLDKPQRLWTQDDWSIIDLSTNSYSTVRDCKVPLPRPSGHEGDEPPTIQWFWQPNGHAVVSPDHVWIWTSVPLSAERTLTTMHWLVSNDAEEGRDYDVEKLTNLSTVTIGQDIALCVEMQNGVRMRNYTPGPLNPHHQAGIIEYYRWYERCLAERPL